MDVIYDLDDLTENKALSAIHPRQLYYINEKDALKKRVFEWQDFVSELMSYCTEGWLNPRYNKIKTFINNKRIYCENRSVLANQKKETHHVHKIEMTKKAIENPV